MRIRTFTERHAQAVAEWRYPGRYRTYDVNEVVTSEAGFWAVEHDVSLVGYCCFGHGARVPGAVGKSAPWTLGTASDPISWARVWAGP